VSAFPLKKILHQKRATSNAQSVRTEARRIPADNKQTSFRRPVSGSGLILSHAEFSLPISLAKKRKAVKDYFPDGFWKVIESASLRFRKILDGV
jgi:hypothetical protein